MFPSRRIPFSCRQIFGRLPQSQFHLIKTLIIPSHHLTSFHPLLSVPFSARYHSMDAIARATITADQQDAWNISAEQATSAIERMNDDKLTQDEMKDELRVFLYAKGCLENERSLVRKTEFDCLLNADNANVSDQERKKLIAARNRLERIVITGEGGQTFGNGGATNLFETFVSNHPEWGTRKSFVIFRDHPLLKDKPHAYVQRIRLSGLCFMHAPVILQHYLVAMHSKDPVPMLNMAMYLTRHLRGRALENRIWFDEGGESLQMLENILLQDPYPELHPVYNKSELPGFLEKYGPALVSQFKVGVAFLSHDTWQHLGRNVEPVVGKHAMVLVGYRMEAGSFRYLIQNWWKKKPFVEVDASYLDSCNASVTLVKTPQLAMGSFPTNSYEHVECEMLDTQETLVPEQM